ncbi:MAG: hypothetical protein HYU56_00885 [Candidatus Aenigmarchaeota archaeon]|nr:hypothetical protein [Candidatus Aenigmarchaeota archaeon]
MTLPEPPKLRYGPVKVYRMTNEGKKLPPDVHPEDMVRGVHYRLRVISVETIREMAAQRERHRKEAEKTGTKSHNQNGYKQPQKQESE